MYVFFEAHDAEIIFLIFSSVPYFFSFYNSERFEPR